ncbi:hypothetical protein SLEP1_g40216 [Rubroshorea leprosula]|uniref:CW-type domain-containing protein n=1 Tax=Rubroshorea leprosula TaxID=152421 RepID=A0AAV5L2W9_9ROSI|nr:hypothetical protein SLEP1_g40216 [Rubroshorea leprosula]
MFGGVKMEENSGLEEGEACYPKDDDETIDPDIDLAYIDEKLQTILGHFQKDFEGGVSAENLGAKFGGYGSFLPAYECSPSRLSHSKTLEKNFSTPRSPNNLPLEGASQNYKALPDASLTWRNGNDSCSVSVKQDSCLSFVHATDKSTLKEKTLNRSKIPAEQNLLKFRIKVSDTKSKKNAEIYSGLGLDDSPSSSLGNSPEESRAMLGISQESMNESPASILQVMTSFQVPSGELVSPLHESLLCLFRKEKERPCKGTEPMPSLNDGQELSACLLNEPVLTKGKPLAEKKAKFIEKIEKLLEPKHNNGVNVVDDKMLLLNKKAKNEIRGVKGVLANDLNVADPVEPTARTSEVTMETSNVGISDELFCSNLAKPDSLESIAGGNSNNSKKWNFQSCSSEKELEQCVENSNKDESADLGGSDRGRANKSSAPSKCKEDKRKKISVKSFLMRDQINMPFDKEKPLSKGNKSKSSQSTGKAAISTMDKTTISHGVLSSKNKMHKLKLKKDINKVRNNHRDSLDTNCEQKGNLMDLPGRQFGNRPKVATIIDFETQQGTYGKNQKETFFGPKVDNQLFGACANDASSVVCVAKNVLAFEGAPPPVAPAVDKDDWVCCDSCQKWRLLPHGRTTDQLPDKWLCSMLDWLPGMNSCNFSEEETTQALNAYYQIPFSQSNLQNNGNGTLSLPTAYLQDQDLNNFGFTSLSLQAKKEHSLKAIPKADGIHGLTQRSNSTKSQLQESAKSRSLNEMTQLPMESNVMKKFSFQPKEKHRVEGLPKQTKMKSKRELDHYAFEGPKKRNKEDKYSTDKRQNSNSDLKRVGSGLPTQESEKGRQKYDECSNSQDVRCEVKERPVASVKKLANQTQALADGLDARILDRTDNMGKKRKLKDRQESQNGHEFYVEEENSECGSRKEKRSQVSKNEMKQSHRHNANDLSNRKFLDDSVDVAEEVRGVDNTQHISKPKRKDASQNNLDGLNSSRRHSVTQQVPIAATSSSSKVSGSHKTRVNFEAPKGSPVESVSSSPMRNLYPVKLTSAGDTSGKDDTMDGDVPGRGNGKRSWDGEGAGNLGQTGMEKGEKVSHKFSKLDFWDGDANRTIGIKTRPYSGFGNGSLTNGDVYAKENVVGLRDQHTPEHSDHEKDRVNKNNNHNALFPQGYGGDSSSKPKDNKQSSLSDKMVYGMITEQEGLHSKKSTGSRSDTDLKDHSLQPGVVSENKCNIIDDSSTKPSKAGKNSKVVKNSLGRWSGDHRMENQSREKECDELDAKSAAICSTNQKIFPQKNVVQDFGGESKAKQVESRSGVPKSFSHCEIETKQETEDHGTFLEARQVVAFDGFPSSSESPRVLLKQPANAGNNGRADQSVEQNLLNLHVLRSTHVPSPGRMNSSGLTATGALKEAKDLKLYADRLKTSSFGFESNEMFFQAALKFLHGASLLETSNSESGRNGEINQMQAYTTAARLCERCGQEYEKHKEMAAAALAYKCMEVAYMRIVFCKHSTSNQDRNELQATVSMVPQGESPSSSASDVDNLNNQATAEKATLSKGTVSHVSGIPIVVARNRPGFVRLLDFMQDVNFAMEASTKSQNAFGAAKLTLEEAQKVECITSVRKVIDFSFQDVEGLICLVQLAKEAIRRSGIRWC